MTTIYSPIPTPDQDQTMSYVNEPQWAIRALLLWQHRRVLARVAGISLAASLCISFAIPKQYKSSTSIMPPEQQGAGAMLLTALSSRAGGLGALGGLAGGLL
ncbi:MAG: Wzz/FepE/Etk N-terminal domain-containing protein, partial [Terracidiphilus sp.]